MLEWVQEGEGGLAEGRCVRRGGTGLVSGVQEADAKRGCGNMNGKVSKVGARSVGADVRLVSSRIVWDNTKIACTCACVCVCVCKGRAGHMCWRRCGNATVSGIQDGSVNGSNPRGREGGHESLKGRKYWIIPERAGDDEE